MFLSNPNILCQQIVELGAFFQLFFGVGVKFEMNVLYFWHVCFFNYMMHYTRYKTPSLLVEPVGLQL